MLRVEGENEITGASHLPPGNSDAADTPDATISAAISLAH